MNERGIQSEVTRSVTVWGGYALKVRDGFVCPNCGKVAIPPVGRADYDCTLGQYGFKIEVKYASKSFVLSEFREDQREWATWYVMDRKGVYFLWLSMGERVGGKKRPRKTWLIPLRDWLVIEREIGMYQKSMPYYAGRGYPRDLQNNGLDAVRLCRDFELDWQGNGIWLPRRELFPVP